MYAITRTEEVDPALPPLPIRSRPLGELMATTNVGIMDNNDPIDAIAIWNADAGAAVTEVSTAPTAASDATAATATMPVRPPAAASSQT